MNFLPQRPRSAVRQLMNFFQAFATTRVDHAPNVFFFATIWLDGVLKAEKFWCSQYTKWGPK